MNYLSTLAVFFSLFIGGIANATPVKMRDKIGQMLIIGFEGSRVDTNSPIIKAIQDENIGGVILFDFNPKTTNFDKNIESPLQVRQLNYDLQQANTSAQTKYHRRFLPLLISIDYEGGERGTRLNPMKGFPETSSAEMVGKIGVPLANKNAEAMATTLQNLGFNLNFAPDMDVNVNPDNPIIGKLGRSFSSDPNDVAIYAGIYSHHFLYHKIQCAYKHFPGHGSATADSHLGFVDISNTWKPEELEPYVQLIGQEQSCDVVMTAHLVNRKLDESGLPATLSYKVITTLLREKLKFNGVVITDDMQMKAITNHYTLERAVTLSINAGADMLIFGNQLTDVPQDPKAIIDIIEEKVQLGEISEQRINEAYQHIITMKKTL